MKEREKEIIEWFDKYRPELDFLIERHLFTDTFDNSTQTTRDKFNKLWKEFLHLRKRR